MKKLHIVHNLSKDGQNTQVFGNIDSNANK